MKRPINTMLLICAHLILMLQFWYFVTPASAVSPYDLGESWYLKDVDYHKDWHVPPGSSTKSSKEHLTRYLARNLEDRQNSLPFFLFPPHTDFPPDTPGFNSLGLMNDMLQSEEETWPKYIQEILKTLPSFRIKNFWGFISDLSDFMTTPILQKTLFELHEEEKLMEGRDRMIYKQVRDTLSQVLITYEKKMQEHIGLLEYENKPKEVIDIFTGEEQKKLGKYRMILEKHWPENDQVHLYKVWGSHMRTYMSVQGSVKGILELQAIQVKRLQTGTSNAPSRMHAVFQNSLDTRCQAQALTNEIVESVGSLDHVSFEQLYLFQRQDHYGIYEPLFDEPLSEERKVFVFWIKYMPFFLEMRSWEGIQHWQCVMTMLIECDTQEGHLESIMQQFLQDPSLHIHSSSKELIHKFLVFAYEKPGDRIFKGLIKDALKEMRQTPNMPWTWQAKIEFQKMDAEK